MLRAVQQRLLDVQFARPEVDDVGSKEPVVATMGAASEGASAIKCCYAVLEC